MFKTLINSFIEILPYGFIVLLIGLTFITAYQHGLDFNEFVKILEILIWPLVIIMVLLFFRRVLTYLFFSIDEFNFFGAKGSLKDVRVMIQEKATEINIAEKNQLIVEKEREIHRKQLEAFKADKNIQRQEAISFAEKVIRSSEKISQENQQLRKQYNALLTNARYSDNQVPIVSTDSLVETIDVGETNQVSVTSDNQ